MKELAADGIPVAVTCRVLQLARQPYYRWLADPVTAAEVAEAYRANALFDAHRDDPEFGYRFLADEAHEAGETMAERTAWRRSARAIGGGARSASPGAARTPNQGRLSTMIWCSGTSAATHQIVCGSATSPNIAPVKASCICVRSKTCSPTGSSAIRSIHE